MNETEKKKLLSWGSSLKIKWNKDTFLIMVLVGVLLFIIALPMENRKTDESTKGKSTELTDKNTGVISNAGTQYTTQEMEYAKELEVKLQETLQYMEGVGKVKVMVTLQSSEEQVIEKDSTNTRAGTTETDSEGGNRTSNEMSNETVSIYEEDENGVQKPYVVKKILPNIEGVIVIAQGGNNLSTNKNITEAIQALFGIEVHKIKVVKMKS